MYEIIHSLEEAHTLAMNLFKTHNATPLSFGNGGKSIHQITLGWRAGRMATMERVGMLALTGNCIWLGSVQRKNYLRFGYNIGLTSDVRPVELDWWLDA
jgi:hypothetical protein